MLLGLFQVLKLHSLPVCFLAVGGLGKSPAAPALFPTHAGLNKELLSALLLPWSKEQTGEFVISQH